MRFITKSESEAVSGGVAGLQPTNIRVEIDRQGSPLIRWLPDGTTQQVILQGAIITGLLLAKHYYGFDQIPPILVA